MSSPRKLTGAEPFSESGAGTVLDFWRWAFSDLKENVLRGVLAEYIVKRAARCTQNLRVEWDTYDITTPSGIKVEVKSTATEQSWGTATSKPNFDINPSQAWDRETRKYVGKRKRHADVYVFCLHEGHDPLNIASWSFYVLSTKVLDAKLGNQKTLALSRLPELGATKCSFAELARVIDATARSDSQEINGA